MRRTDMDRAFETVREDVLPRLDKLCRKQGDQVLLAMYVVTLECLRETGVSRAELRFLADLVYPEAPELRVVEK